MTSSLLYSLNEVSLLTGVEQHEIVMAAMSPSESPAVARRTTMSRALTAPDKMAINGHFASVGQNGSADFENGVQVIDEEKEFKYVLCWRKAVSAH